MLTVILVFFLTALISFAGSLQIGPVNYFVMETSLRQNKTAGILVAIGGSIPEFIYSLLAITIGISLQENQLLFAVFKWITILLLLALAVYYFFKKVVQSAPPMVSKKGSFLKGLTLGLLNPQLLPFWLVVYTSFFVSIGFTVSTFSEQMAFVLGTGTGAFALHLFLIYLVQVNRSRLEKLLYNPNFNRFLSVFFLLLAVFQLVSL